VCSGGAESLGKEGAAGKSAEKLVEAVGYDRLALLDERRREENLATIAAAKGQDAGRSARLRRSWMGNLWRMRTLVASLKELAQIDTIFRVNRRPLRTTYLFPLTTSRTFVSR
jgi:hypothetical protein